MNKQPEALRLADALEKFGYAETDELAAAELRRLHALNVDMLVALKGLLADITEYQTINHLGGENNHWQVIARVVIAKAEGKQ